jgi:hypothetical protein
MGRVTGGTVSAKPHEKPSRRQLLTGAGAAGAARVAPSTGGALAAVATAGSPAGMDVDGILDRQRHRAVFDAIPPGAGARKGSR